MKLKVWVVEWVVKWKLKPILRRMSMGSWYTSRTIWASIIGMVAWAITILSKGKVIIGTEDQAQMIDLIINLLTAGIPFISFLIVIIRKILKVKEEEGKVVVK
jgi:ABC-type methionine transport system permease subunit